jgi:hypothetical protein
MTRLPVIDGEPGHRPMVRAVVPGAGICIAITKETR